MRSIYAVFIFTFTSFLSAAQPFSTDSYYLFPINPGQQNYLAGTMGELRSSHFHAGLDIKTGGQTGWPVYATADGYVSRVRITNGGYGHSLYINHPNGTTSVYAHLSKFSDEIDRYVLENQYEDETFEIQLFPDKKQFEFKQGDIIAFSGNTGSSSGPHLHFEIRDSNQRILDPLRFNFSEIKDNIAPQVKDIAFVSLDGNARINDTFGRFEFDVLKSYGTYKPRTPINLSGNIGIEIYAYDLLNGVYNRNGIPKTTLVVNGDTIFSELKTNLSFSNQKSILVHMDYERYRNGGPKYNKLFVDDGNGNDFYSISNRGHVFNDSIEQDIKIYLEDSYGNISTVEVQANTRKVINKPDPVFSDYELFRNHLHFKSLMDSTEGKVSVFLRGVKNIIEPYRKDRKVAYALWDLRHGLPDSIQLNGKIIHTDIYATIPSETAISFYNHDFDIAFRNQSLFDTLYLRFEKDFDTFKNLELFRFPLGDVPFQSSMKVTLKPRFQYPDSTARVYSVHGSRLSFMGGEWNEDGNIDFIARDLGTFTIAEDTTPPTITPRIVNSSELYFKITDDMSGIKSYRATLNGKFLLMEYESKKDLIWARRLNSNNAIKGEFILEVVDNTNNKSIYQRNLN
ncbi:MAG: M23 family metallopeptidase [Marinoscillum sp.]